MSTERKAPGSTVNERLFDRRDQVAPNQGLTQEPDSYGRTGMERCSQHHDRERARCLIPSEMVDQLQPIHDRHPEVDEDEIDLHRPGRKRIERLGGGQISRPADSRQPTADSRSTRTTVGCELSAVGPAKLDHHQRLLPIDSPHHVVTGRVEDSGHQTRDAVAPDGRPLGHRHEIRPQRPPGKRRRARFLDAVEVALGPSLAASPRSR